MKPRILACALAASLAATAGARADETTYCNAFITALPYTITAQGHYCFNRNLSTAITTGAAITIDADYVVLDLNNFKLGGGAAGPATDAVGISASGRNNVTVRGGNIRGFAHGIFIDSPAGPVPGNIVVENNVVEGNLKTGINVYGHAVVVRHNFVTYTGGSTSPNVFCSGTEGISTRGRNCDHAISAIVQDNVVMFTSVGFGSAWTVSIENLSGIVKNNVVSRHGDGTSNGQAIRGGLCQGNTVHRTARGPDQAFACLALEGNVAH